MVANHSGTLPVDALMTTVALHDEHPAQRRLRLLGADLVFELPFIGSMARKMGTTLACNEDAERLLTERRAGRRLPRGLQGHRQAVPRAVHAAAVRPRRFRHGRAAHRRADHPVRDRRRRGDLPDDRQRQDRGAAARACRTSRSRRRSRCSARSGLVPLPSKWLIAFGEPIETASYGPAAAEDPMLVFNLTDQVRETIQQSLYQLLLQRKSVFG